MKIKLEYLAYIDIYNESTIGGAVRMASICTDV